MRIPVISLDQRIQQAYESMRLAGESHNMAELLATRHMPGIMTDSVFLEGRGINNDQFAKTPDIGKFYRKKAKQAGVSVTGKVYLSGLARFPGDPQAWISSRGDVRSICRKRNWSCEGAVKVNSTPRDPGPPIPLAPDIVEREVEKIIALEPEKKSKRAELREEVLHKYTPHWKKNLIKT